MSRGSDARKRRGDTPRKVAGTGTAQTVTPSAGGSIDTKSHNERRRYRSILVRSRDVKDERMTRTSVMGLR